MGGELLIPILGIIAVSVLYSKLNRRISDLESKISEWQGKKTEPLLAPSFQPGTSQMPLASAVSTPPQVSAPAIREPDVFERLIDWLKEDWLLKLGALLLLLGFGWLASYAFINGWIGPAGRIACGVALGALIMVLGFWRMQKYVAQGAIFLVLGSTAILLTLYAARSLYDFFTPLTALGLMFLTSAFVALASVIYDRKQLGAASVILAGIAPLLTNSPNTDYVGLFMYLAVVVTASVILAAIKGHREVIFTALVVVGAYSVPVLLGAGKAEHAMLLWYAYGFAALFFASNTISLMRLTGKDATSDLLVAAGNAFLLAAWIYVVVPEHTQSLMYAAIAVAFVCGAFLTSLASKRFESFYVYAGIGVAYIAIATAAELQGAVLTIAYTIEAGVVALLTFILARNVKVALQSVMLLAVPSLMSFQSVISSSWGKGVVLHADFFVLFILSAVYFLLGAALFQAAHASGDENVKSQNAALFVVGSIYAFILLWLSLHELMPDDTAVLVSLVIYTIVGIAAYVTGLSSGAKGLRNCGGVLLGFVVGRLLFIDVWDMALAWRIVTFFAIGVLLMSTAFLSKKKPQPPMP